jgi:hypothetical protein
MSAELSLMVDENGGNIVWVQRAFGPFLGWINAFNYLVSAFASMALYPILVIDYLPQHWQVPHTPHSRHTHTRAHCPSRWAADSRMIADARNRTVCRSARRSRSSSRSCSSSC